MQILNNRRLLIGMIHLLPLPGTARYGGSFNQVIDAALADAKILHKTGFDALMVENFGDVPFRKNRVEPHTIAAMTVAASAVGQETGLPLGINVLRNDAFSALGIAGTVGAQCIRVNILAGTMATDQGIIEGEAPDVSVYRQRIAPETAVLADVHVKHARPLVDRPIEEVAVETVERAGANGLILTGTRTGGGVDVDELHRVRNAVDAPLYAGSGVSTENIREILNFCDGAIVGSSLKLNGIVTNPVNLAQAERFIDAAKK